MAAVKPLFPVTLAGRHVRLEPLSARHRDALLAAASEDRATYTLTGVPGDVECGNNEVVRASGEIDSVNAIGATGRTGSGGKWPFRTSAVDCYECVGFGLTDKCYGLQAGLIVTSSAGIGVCG